jgi:hypothetical protein
MSIAYISLFDRFQTEAEARDYVFRAAKEWIDTQLSTICRPYHEPAGPQVAPHFVKNEALGAGMADDLKMSVSLTWTIYRDSPIGTRKTFLLSFCEYCLPVFGQ